MNRYSPKLFTWDIILLIVGLSVGSIMFILGGKEMLYHLINKLQ